MRPAKFDRDILAFCVAGFGEALSKCCKQAGVRLRRARMEEADHRQCVLLRARRARPRRRRAADERDEVAPSHAKLPVEDKAYQSAALCVTAKLRADVADGSIATDRHARAARAMSALPSRSLRDALSFV